MLQGKSQQVWDNIELEEETFELHNDNENEADFLTPLDDISNEEISRKGDFDTASFEETYMGELERGGDQPVPRISIQVFCESPETAQLMQSASTDRRIAKANVTVCMGGLNEAIDFYQTQPVPNLIIVECLGTPSEMVTKLDSLAALCDENVKVIMLGRSNDIGLYRELMRRGVSEYLVPPLQPLQIIRAISTLYIDPSKPYLGQSIVFIGAKGGVGSSTIAHNVSWCMAEHARVNTTLVDLDLSWGTTGLDFNIESTTSVLDALETPDRVDDVLLDRLLTRHTDRLTLFTAPNNLDKNPEIVDEAYDVVIDGVRRGVPFVVLDLPHQWNAWTKKTVMEADHVVLVAEPDLAGLRNAKNLYDLIKHTRKNDAPPKVILNKVGIPKRPEIPLKEFSAALGTDPVLVLPYEPQLFGTAANNGQMISDVNPQSKCSEGFDYLAATFTGRMPIKKEKSSVFDKLKIKLNK